MNTPIPVAIKNHRGIKNNMYVQNNNLNVISASARSWELPVDSVTVSHSGSSITFRYTSEARTSQWGGWSRYAQIICFGNDYQQLEYSGVVLSLDKHKAFMETFNAMYPIAVDIFSN